MSHAPDATALRARLLRAMRWLPALAITMLGLAIIWPVPIGEMPLSADHTVHLTRTWMWAQELGAGNVRGWSPVWFFGTPVGELYPVLGDALIIAVRVASFGSLSWPAAYAVGFTLVFVAQGWVLLRAGRALGWGVMPGLVAASLALLDVGSYREGGYIYTVYYGVWPQALATSLTWLGLAELTALATEVDPAKARRKGLHASLAMGAALLAHPMSMAVLAFAGPAVVFVTGLRSPVGLRKTTARGLLCGALGVAVAAWWVVPMFEHRAWMASYGWLWQPLEILVKRALEGQWAQSMPSLAGHCVTGGLFLVALAGTRAARAFALVTLGLWLMSAADVPWELRLDLVSEGFTHLQYQRFLTAAKPGLFLMAGALVGGVWHFGLQLWRRRSLPLRATAVLCWGLTLAALGGIASGQSEELDANPVDTIQRARMPRLPELDDDYRQLVAWMNTQWAQRDRDYRYVVYDQRNTHWFMDAPVFTDGTPILKLGFTPGDNFVHKPEKGPADLLDRAQVRYEIRRGQRKRRNTVARFGQISVIERPTAANQTVAQLLGPGTVEVLESDVDNGRVRVRVTGATDETRLLYGIAGYPRWDLTGPDGALEWTEAPATGFGPGATWNERRSGVFRGGKAHGDDGSEPTLIHSPATTDGEYVLEYVAWRLGDILSALLSLAALALAVAMLLRGERTAKVREAWDRLVQRLLGLGHPVVWVALAAALLLAGTVRLSRGRAAESPTALGWIEQGRASQLTAARGGYLKVDMLIRPAVVFDRRHKKPATVVFDGVPLGSSLQGWVAMDDDDAKQRKQGTVRLRVEVWDPSTEDWHRLHERPVRHTPGFQDLDLVVPAALAGPQRVRVTAEADGKRPPQVGVSFELGDGA